MRADNDNERGSGRFRVEPRCVPASGAARRLHLTREVFANKRDDLIAIGFPRPCMVTGHYDLKAIDHWLDVQAGLSRAMPNAARDASDVFAARLAAFE